MTAIKVNILQVTERRKGDNYNTYDVEYQSEGVTYSATQFGKQPLPTGEGEYDIIKDGDMVKIKKVRTEFKGGAKWQPKTREQLQLEEEVKYPSFAVSYAKDLVITGKFKEDDIPRLSALCYKVMLDLSQDKITRPAESKKPDTVNTANLPSKDDDDLPF